MAKIPTLLFIFYLNIPVAFSQASLIKQWDKRFGGTDYDIITSFKTTTTGGYIFGGYSASGSGGDKTQPLWGGTDFWVVKIDAVGTKIWDKRFGGTGYDTFYDVEETLDGGFLLAGTSSSPISGDKSETAWSNSTDFWVVKVDATGIKQWDKRYGGTAEDYLSAVRQTPDGNYLLAGYSNSPLSGDKSQPAWSGSNDYWIIKIDATGTKLWDKRFGGTASEYLTCMDLTSDGGCILGGWSGSGISGDKTENSRGFDDYWIVKIDASGNKQWDKRFGGNQGEEMNSVQQTTDGGYILAGSSGSGINGDRSENSRGIWDFWIVKTDASGIKLWDKRYGGSGWDQYVHTVKQTTDGGYLLCGISDSPLSGDKSESNLGLKQAWMVKTSVTGVKVWDKTIKTNGYDRGSYGAIVNDTCYAFAIETDGGVGGYKTQTNMGFDDYWIIKYCDTAAIVFLPIELLSFTASVENASIALQWSTASEINNQWFELQRSAFSLDDFKTIYQTEGQEWTSQPTSYSYRDADIEPNITYYYRLRQIDYSGAVSYSKVVSARMQGAGISVNLFPNPFIDEISIVWATEENTAVVVELFNSLGQKITSVNFDSRENDLGIYTLNTKFLELNPGFYLCRVMVGKEVYVARIVKG